MTKIKVSEVIIGQTVKGNLGAGTHVVAEIKTGEMTMRAGVTAKTLSFYNADGEEFFIGRTYAKATIV